MMIKKKNLLLFFLLLITMDGFCQNYTDWQYRLIPGVSYRFNDHWKVSGEYRYTAQKDFQEFRSSGAEFTVQYNFNKEFSIETGYRFTSSYTADSHRLFGALKYDKELGDFTLFGAMKYQFSTGSFNERYMNDFKEPVQMVREKIGVDYNVPKSKLSFNTSVEIFLKLADDDPIKYNRTRYTIGSAYKFKYGNKLGISVFYDDKYNPKKTDRFVLETKYTLIIDDMIKKIKKNKEKKATQG
ncbi:hypothetical protein FEDK69T_04720 [Flavobacterium enshiense DK69]|uniref:DUF2490 domain-containing protein n=1 Tax=Flavobacterium enshiense DK69 TaxID=1107311 RepID=V6SF80_9FLAO|nr:DUF2490 domain-containing protein [Flavobacterium enshiense]ESU24917.1 hypothetical protein FEDK69T_04720 [Flavobacterium enshiense DK69]KGO96641.1 hypothetical protein Q767_02710 [Flavobacterium enshiense DK69]